MTTVHLIDGTYELFRTWFALPEMKAPDGREVGATRGMLRSLATWLRRGEVAHAAVAFDHVVESFRNALFDGYKTGEGLDPDLLAQFPLAERATAALGLVTWPMVEVEADDAIASGAARFADEPGVERIVLCSPDKDLCQCVVGDRVVVWDRFRDVRLDEDGVRAKFGVPPASIPDYLALVGDAADGIPGIARWGKKSAATLLSRYGRIEDIPDDAARWEVPVRGARGLAEALASHRDEVSLYKRLATLRTDAPIRETLDELAWQGPDDEALDALCSEIGEDRGGLKV